MNPTVSKKKKRRFLKVKKHPVKLTALLYLKDALLAERYEECAGCIRVARDFGASLSEISYLLENPYRVPR